MRGFMYPQRLLDPTQEGSAGAADPNEQIVEIDEGPNGIQRYKVKDLVQRYNTYRGKASEFDAKAREAAELKRQSEEWKQAADQFTRQKQAAEKLKSGEFDPEAFKIVAQGLGLPEEQVAATLRELEAAQGASAHQGGGSEPQVPTGYGLSAVEVKELQELRQILKGFKASGLDPVKALKESVEFKDTANENWKKQTLRQFVVDRDKILGKMISDPENGQAVFGRLWAKISDMERGGAQFSPDTIQKAVAEERAFLAAFEKAVPVPSGPGPYSLGNAPSGGTFSRLTTPKEPDIKSLAQTGDVKGFLRQFAEYAQHQEGK